MSGCHIYFCGRFWIRPLAFIPKPPAIGHAGFIDVLGVVIGAKFHAALG